MTSKNHYNEEYFQWQSKVGKFGAQANKVKFNKVITPNSKVLDFGCGGGFFLSLFENIEKHGVEINPHARSIAEKNKIKVFKSSSEIPNEYYDIVISNNALEHTDNPLLELKELYRGLKKEGKICIIVPLDSINYKFEKDDKDFHLYSWSPMNLGNILTAAGFEVIESKPFIHKWFPFHMYFKKIMSWKLFHIFCFIYGRINKKWVQVRAIAKKK